MLACYTARLAAMNRARKALSPPPALTIAPSRGSPLLLFAWTVGERIVPGNWLPVILLALGGKVPGRA
ncbi:hypothetical protein [Flavisphingomonas formosensis]|uniref:hypothetical protein n=1 Tax=Flavisphingomonas formosensis TaxID=861534 RepID=UPI0012F7DE11|nr:hypothetical protein [Sphingomonas formosensis]